MSKYGYTGTYTGYKAGAALGSALMYRYGNSMPMVPYNGTRMATQSNGFVSKRRGRKNKRTFKSVLYKNLSAKHDNGEQAISFTHNTLYTCNLTYRITQGTTNATRIGDSIVLCGLKIKGFYTGETTANGYGFRFIVGYSGEEYSNGTFSSGLTTTEVFLPNTATNSTTIAQINPKAFTVLYDERLTCNSQISAVKDRVDYNFSVPLNNTTFQYQSSGGTMGKNKNLYMIMIADVLGGTTGVTASGGSTMTWDFVYKNPT